MDNYITSISQSCSNSLKKKSSQKQHYIIIFVDRYKKINGWGSTSITTCRKPSANIRSREAALIVWIPMSVHIHLTPFSGIKMDFQPPASCIIGSTENKSALLEIALRATKLMPHGEVPSLAPSPWHQHHFKPGIAVMPEGPRQPGINPLPSSTDTPVSLPGKVSCHRIIESEL